MERLTTRITMRLITGDDRSRDLDVDWTYRTDDPHAVELDFAPFQPGAVWLLSRDLLMAGLDAPAGEGDVHVAPFDDTRVLIALEGRDGIALLAAPAAAVSGLLAATARLVPPGAEGGATDWDQGLKDLLAA
ncbi:SsgA family sporulation/cell division regulator [Kitasatospora sp. NPDC048365]|uniref:SsgA family sporulation/cell division regulator n=1 Tax=Kitasatospora sp. NPDC048365 TaxID=3364050 RepID=UPI00371298C4